VTHRFGPKTKDDPAVGKPCPACHEPFRIGDFTTVIELGPGADPEEQRKALDGHAYNAVAIEVHWACATGDTTATGW
jgi:hypothetical protein